jgi:hypothetical protein
MDAVTCQTHWVKMVRLRGHRSHVHAVMHRNLYARACGHASQLVRTHTYQHVSNCLNPSQMYVSNLLNSSQPVSNIRLNTSQTVSNRLNKLSQTVSNRLNSSQTVSNRLKPSQLVSTRLNSSQTTVKLGRFETF